MEVIRCLEKMMACIPHYYIYNTQIQLTRPVDSICRCLDSANLKNGFFLFQGKIATNPEPCKIMLKNLAQGWESTKFFILDSGITTVQLYKDSMYNSVFTGNKLQKQFNLTLTTNYLI